METGPAVVIMAGGAGERFWPRSRRALPKQFLRLGGAGSLLQETFRRALLLAPAERVFVVTPARYRHLTCRQLPALPPENLIAEPLGRDTAPCLGLAAATLAAREPAVTMVVLPADHLISGEERFASALAAAARVAAAGRWLVTLGIPPTRPETGYGYIHRGEPLARVGEWEVRAVRRFTEKPGPEQALRFLASGEYLWNSGMFAWRADLFLRLLGEHLPHLTAALARAAAAPPEEREEALRREYERLAPVSVDHGLLERAREVVVIPADFGWDDLGAWSALERVGRRDEAGNVVEGQAVAVESRDCILSGAEGGGRLLVAYGVAGLLVVDAGDVVLVADKGRSATLKRALDELRRRGLGQYLEAAPPADGPGALPAVPGARVVEKPWGREVWWAETDRYVGKIIQVRAGERLSLQLHREKMETMLFHEGSGRVLVGERVLPVFRGLAVTIPPGTVHRVEADTDLVFWEVSTPETGDVVRLADAYGRAPASAEELVALDGARDGAHRGDQGAG